MPDVREVPADQWHGTVASALTEFPHFDWLDCVDDIGRSDTFRITLCLRHDSAEHLLETTVDRDAAELDSISDLIPGATWPERELADLFGLTFTHGDPRPLILPPTFGQHPLRKESVAAARTAMPWPGAKEPGDAGASTPSRRRMAPSGVPDPQVWGSLAADAPAPDPQAVAASSEGGRVRRTRRPR